MSNFHGPAEECFHPRVSLSGSSLVLNNFLLSPGNFLESLRHFDASQLTSSETNINMVGRK